jgi:HSP20 family protein
MMMEMTKNRSREVAQAEPIRQAPRFVPTADVCENEDQYKVWLDMPGVDPKDLDVRFENGTLTVWGKVDPRELKATRLFSEYGVGDYYRTFNVTEAIDAGRISAECEDGVLCLTLPKAEAAKPKRIEVRTKA